MASMAKSMYDNFYYYIENPTLPETKDWFMAGNPLKLITLLICYNFFCLYLGPRYMKNRKPYQLKNVIKIYNIFHFNFYCQGVGDLNSPSTLRIAKVIWVYYIVKIIDLMDTVFFVLRKSNRQITSLHMHHHTLMPAVSWAALIFIPGGQGVLVGYINALVHAVMYTYYLLAGLGDEYKKYLWWKKYLTILQLIQFAVIVAHSVFKPG
ncbi:elongation of very long chain fatty acids protein AAEL008004-like [Nymphalis io]|uniref:elongation of very long chain fatty acids protein AAEL008004-like n=1 Tax=Inachis io TaxID=171585 RepID=UPI002169FB46|nr:elongation of very long chain fatty acids protein AAEL008004-like [Nymphalis io]